MAESLPFLPLPQPTGRNQGAYRGDTIDVAALLTRLDQQARAHGWSVEEMSPHPGLNLPAFRRSLPRPGRRIYLSAGIHGDEPAGPLAVAALLELQDWPVDAEIWLCPCLNPTGFPLNSRENHQGVDLNRDYKGLRSLEVQAHVAWLEQQPSFDLCLCLHEDWEAQGFYVYELNPDGRPSLAEAMVSGAQTVCPIDHSPLIDGREARAGIIRPVLDPSLRPEWPEAFYLYQHHTRLSYTLEAPSDFALPVRVKALVTAVQAAWRAYEKHSTLPQP